MEDEEWFRRRVVEALDTLQAGQKALAQDHKEIHVAYVARIDALVVSLSDHEQADLKRFGELDTVISELKPARTLIYGFVGLMLTGIVAALLALVLK